jgi:hypothetical protein
MMARDAHLTWTAAVLAGILGLAAAPALAQQVGSSTPPGRTGWEFEIHGGSASAGALTTNLGSQLPPPGPTFTDFRGGQSRLVPSWFFGDGALLANQVTQQTGDGVSIVPLDGVLTNASANRQKSRNFGVRIGHSITSHVFAEFAYETVGGQIAIDPAALGAIAATTASFQPYWTAVLTRPSTTNVQASASLAITNDVPSTAKLFVGEAAINIVTIHGWTPYVEIGGGILFPSTAEASATLTGHYQFNLNNMAANNGTPFNETDQIRIQFQPQPAIVKVIGVGVEGNLMRHLGVRADVRAVLGANRIRTRLDTAPTNVPAGKLAVQARGASPSLQISANLQLSGQQSSLSLPGVNHFDTFEAAGRLVLVSVGAFFRF